MFQLALMLKATNMEQITELGGLKFIIISHPHFYTSVSFIFPCKTPPDLRSEHGQTGPQPSNAQCT